jgi:hypothetical protein
MKTSSKTARKKAAVKAVGNALNPAHVTLTVTKFVDVLTSEAPAHERNTECEMKVGTDQPRVAKATVQKGKPPVLRVTGGGATFRFWIGSKIRKETFYPLGIAFRRRNNRGRDNDKKDTLGRKNFSFASMHLWGRAMYITDSFKDCGSNDRYKFSVIIQRQHDGAIGIIDPDLEHDRIH